MSIEKPNSDTPKNEVEQIYTHPMVEDMIALQVGNITNRFLREEFRTAESTEKLGKVLTDYARLIAERMNEMKDLKPLDSAVEGWKRQVANETYALRQGVFADLIDSTFLAERFSDELGGEPQDWLDDEKRNLLNIVALRIFQFTTAVAYCKRFGIDPNLLRQQ